MRRTIYLVSAVLVLLLMACGPATSPPVPTAPPDTHALPPSTTPQPPHPTPQPTHQRTSTPRPTLVFTIGPTRTIPPTAPRRPSVPPTPSITPFPAVGPFVLVPPGANRPDGDIRSLHAGPDGAVWLVTDNGLGRWQDGAWTLLQSGPGTLAGFDDSGRAWWIPGGGEEILAWDGTAWTSYGPGAGWVPPAPGLKSIATDRRGWVWLVGGTTVRTFDGQGWVVQSFDQIGFTADPETAEYDGFRLTKVVRDGEGDIWVGDCDTRGEATAGQGARWFDGTRWGGADSPVTGAGCVNDIELDAQGRLWLGIDSILSRYTPGEGWQQYDPPAAPAGIHALGDILDVAVGPQGDLWATFDVCGGASCGNGQLLFRRQGENWTRVGEHQWNLDIAFAPDGSAWFCAPALPPDDPGLPGGVYHVAGDALELVAGFGECTIEVDAAGQVWVALLGQGVLYVAENP